MGPNVLNLADAVRFTCDRMPAGQLGPTNPNPQNTNPNGNAPPGYDTTNTTSGTSTPR